MRYLLVALSLVAGSVWSAELPPTNVVDFEAQASREVPNDLALATLFIELSEADPARLAEKINVALAAGLKHIKQYPSVQSGGTHFATYPLYSAKNNKQEGWRSRGELKVSSKDFAALSNLVGELQTSSATGSALQLADVSYTVSDEMRRKTEESLITEGIILFKSRADVIQKGMSASGWKMLNMHVNTSGGARPEMRMMKVSRASAGIMDSAPAPIEGGESRLG